jgi:hypothetical protein
MKRTFVVTFVAGLLVVALATTFWPLPNHVRYRSLITVPPDGGRQEDFIIRWPEDRIRRPSDSRSSLPAAAAVGAAVLEDSAGQRASVELFRLRDSDDNVVGIASRLAGTGGAIADPGRSASNWLLVIPSRGALFLSQTDVLDTTLHEQVTADGSMALAPEQTAAFWTDRQSLRVTATAPATTGSRTTGRVLRGTSEFAGLEGTFTETWNLEEVKADGSTQGRILLSTFTAAGT